MASWPENPVLINTRIQRLDGLAKASGKAKYPSDVRPEGTLFGVMLYSPYAHAKVKSIDISAAEKMPGVKAVIAIAKAGGTLRYHGDDIAALAAETEEQAVDAVRAIKVEYEILPHVATEALAMADGAPAVFTGGNVQKGQSQIKGKPVEAMATAEVTIEGTYSVPLVTHVCLETHGLTVRWVGDDKMEVWASTQNVSGIANELGGPPFNIKAPNVTVHTDYMGGGFGSKFGADIWGRTAAQLSKNAGGRPVKMFLDRVQEHLAAGNRPSGAAHIKLGANRSDGKLVALIAETHGTGGVGGAGRLTVPYVYSVPHIQVTQSAVRTNFGSQRAMRAPGHPQSCTLTEAAMDDLADKLGMDPLEFRLKNLAAGDFHTPIYEAELQMGAELIGWREKRKPRGQNGAGPVKTGFGLGLHQWGGGPGGQDKKVSCTISPDGSVELKTATQDLGTGIRTVLAIIAAEILGLKPTDIISNIGNSTFPPGQASGGSVTTGSMSPPCYDAATKAQERTSQKDRPGCEGSARGPLTQGRPALGLGRADDVVERGLPQAGDGLDLGDRHLPARTRLGGVGGCQFAEVAVDIETGMVKVKKIVAIQDSGLIINKLTWESQVYGGVIMGLNYGLFEERVVDPTTGTMLNPDMEMYKLAGAADIPEIIVRAYEPPR